MAKITQADDWGPNSFYNGNLCVITYAAVREAMAGECYEMQLAGADCAIVMQAVNQGIDGHLEACFVPDRGDSYEWRSAPIAGSRLHCQVSPESLPVLLRRLYELDSDYTEEEVGETGTWPGQLADSILLTLGFDDSGQQVGREALGLE